MAALFLVILGIASRILAHTPQFTAILAVAMFGGMYLSRRQALIVPVALMIITDAILGFHDTMAFTWGSMLAISAIGLWLKERKSFLGVLAGSLASSILFFVVTNFGAWLSPLYPHTWQGLTECYILAIPFFKSTLVSTVAYSLVLYAGYEWLLKRSQGTALARLL
ncbi:MAG: hypothetical protein HY591_06245 [Candidatus Omnitrophica bacterium]|nr:hypothetical protein [Candidatus Omnitrophota bacterium]